MVVNCIEIRTSIINHQTTVYIGSQRKLCMVTPINFYKGGSVWYVNWNIHIIYNWHHCQLASSGWIRKTWLIFMIPEGFRIQGFKHRIPYQRISYSAPRTLETTPITRQNHPQNTYMSNYTMPWQWIQKTTEDPKHLGPSLKTLYSPWTPKMALWMRIWCWMVQMTHAHLVARLINGLTKCCTRS